MGLTTSLAAQYSGIKLYFIYESAYNKNCQSPTSPKHRMQLLDETFVVLCNNL